MKFSFASKKLEERLTDQKSMKRAYGEVARKLQMRLDVLKQAQNLAEVPVTPPHRRHLLTGEWEGHFAVDVSENRRLIFRPDHDPVLMTPDGGIDVAQVTAVRFVDVTDYH